jgi:hypothetical protein
MSSDTLHKLVKDADIDLDKHPWRFAKWKKSIFKALHAKGFNQLDAAYKRVRAPPAVHRSDLYERYVDHVERHRAYEEDHNLPFVDPPPPPVLPPTDAEILAINRYNIDIDKERTGSFSSLELVEQRLTPHQIAEVHHLDDVPHLQNNPILRANTILAFFQAKSTVHSFSHRTAIKKIMANIPPATDVKTAEHVLSMLPYLNGCLRDVQLEAAEDDASMVARLLGLLQAPMFHNVVELLTLDPNLTYLKAVARVRVTLTLQKAREAEALSASHQVAAPTDLYKVNAVTSSTASPCWNCIGYPHLTPHTREECGSFLFRFL